MDRINKMMKGDFGIFLHKILGDVLAVLLISFFLLLISEGMLPGLFSAYLSFTKLTMLIFAVLGGIIYLGKLNGISFEINNKKTVLFGGLTIFSILLIINSLLKFAWWEIGVIAIISISLLFYFHKNFLKSEM
ncbi:MAG: hypothetical protein V1804_04115 [Patescibacteria group bacterium]